MNAVEKQDLISIEEYLAGELTSPIKHEFLGGIVHAMAGAKIEHNSIVRNITTTFDNQLQDRPCEPHNSDTKIRIRLPSQTRFYYPDVSVVCESNDRGESFQDKPVVIVEVLSRSTRRIDLGEKKDAYLTIPSLQAYLIVEQELAKIVVFRRQGDTFEREVYVGLDAVVPLPEIDCELPLATAYLRASFAPEVDDDEQ